MGIPFIAPAPKGLRAARWPPPNDAAPAAAEPDDALTLAACAERADLEYALSVVKGRALPDMR